MQAKYEEGKILDLLINKMVHLLRSHTRMILFHSGFPFTGCILSRISKSALISFVYSRRGRAGIHSVNGGHSLRSRISPKNPNTIQDKNKSITKYEPLTVNRRCKYFFNQSLSVSLARSVGSGDGLHNALYGLLAGLRFLERYLIDSVQPP